MNQWNTKSRPCAIRRNPETHVNTGEIVFDDDGNRKQFCQCTHEFSGYVTISLPPHEPFRPYKSLYENNDSTVQQSFQMRSHLELDFNTNSKPLLIRITSRLEL